MLTQNLTLDDASGDAVTFNLQSYLPDGARRIAVTSTPSEPYLLEIKHTTSGQGSNAVDRHLISSSMTKYSTASVPRKAIVNLTLTVPRDTTIAQTDILDCLAAVLDLVTGGTFGDSGIGDTANVLSILRGES